MTTQEIKDFLHLNERFHLIAGEIILKLNEKLSKDEIVEHIGVVGEMELTSDLRRLSGKNAEIVWFHECGDGGLFSIKIPLKAFSASPRERAVFIQEAIDEVIETIKKDTEDNRKRREDEDRLDYERLRKRFEGK